MTSILKIVEHIVDWDFLDSGKKEKVGICEIDGVKVDVVLSCSFYNEILYCYFNVKSVDVIKMKDSSDVPVRHDFYISVHRIEVGRALVKLGGKLETVRTFFDQEIRGLANLKFNKESCKFVSEEEFKEQVALEEGRKLRINLLKELEEVFKDTQVSVCDSMDITCCICFDECKTYFDECATQKSKHRVCLPCFTKLETDDVGERRCPLCRETSIVLVI